VKELALGLWFLGWSVVRVQQLGWTGVQWDLSFIGRDFWIYRNAGLAVLDGTDPWLASFAWNGTDWHFAAPPIAAQLFVPFALIAGSLSLILFLALSVGAAWAALRALKLPAWWLLFPPMTEGILAANPQILLFGLIVIGMAPTRIPTSRHRIRLAGWLAARAVAVGLKIYGIVPIVARREWRALAATAGLVALSVAIAPDLWVRYLTGFGDISSRILGESQGGLSAGLFLEPSIFGTLIPNETAALAVGLMLYGLMAGLVLLAAVRDVEGAAWIAAPLLWPAAEYHLATMAIPAARRLAVLLIAVPSVPTYLFGLIVLTYQVTAGHRPLAAARPPVGLVAWLMAFRRSPGSAAVARDDA
jgi:glycosyl transferase family 87